jgi:hypothetical protein
MYCPPNPNNDHPLRPNPLQLQFACSWWSVNLYDGASKTDTHDLGFMIQPWARKAWELNSDGRAFAALVKAAESLASRFNYTVGCLRSWDVCETTRYSFKDPSKDFLVIIDNMISK